MLIEEKLIDLETRIAYQDKLLEELNEVIYKQQLTINEMEKIVKDLINKVDNDINTAHIRPPHY